MAEEEIQLTEEEIALAQEPLDGQGEPTEEAKAQDTEQVADDQPENQPEDPPEEEQEQEGDADETPSETLSLNDEDYTLGESYGLTKEEVDDLGSRELLEKFGKIAARQMIEGKKPEQQEQQQEQQESSDEPDDKQESPAWDISKIDLDEYDDVTRSAFNAIDDLQKQLAELKQQNTRLQATQEDSALQEFGMQLDAIDPEFFGVQYGKNGKSKKLQKEQMERRMKLAEAIDVMTAGYSSQGRQIPDIETLVRDANAITFRDRVSDIQKKEASQKLKKQAARRQTAGSRVRRPVQPADPYDNEEAEIQRILAETDEAYQRMLEEN